MAATEYTPRQRAALSWAALVRTSAPWRDLVPHLLSFTKPGCGPGEQLFGSLARCFAQTGIAPGCAAGLGFAALTNADGTVDAEDADQLLVEWCRLLSTPPRPTLRKELPS